MSTSDHIIQLTVMLPAYGEADNLRELLPQLKCRLDALSISYEILVLDTQVPVDDTRAVCESVGVRCLPRQNGNNYGDAIRTGIAASQGKYVVVMDADGSHTPEFVEKFWENREKADLVIASRYVAGGSTKNPLLLVGMSRILNVVFKVALRLPVFDVSNSFRLYRGDMLRGLTLTYLHFDIMEEILAKMLWNNPVSPARCLEIPYQFEQRKYGKPKRNLLVFGVHFIRAFLRLRAMRRQSELGRGPSV